MRRHGVLAICLICSLGVGCQENLHKTRSDRNLDVELVKSLHQIGLDNALIAQQTLYPYHFVSNGEKLNELGLRDLSVLARHYTAYEGTLNVRREETPPQLYEARITHVIAELKDAGVDADRISIADGMPGGSGMPSERVVAIMRKDVESQGSTKTLSYSGKITQ